MANAFRLSHPFAQLASILIALEEGRRLSGKTALERVPRTGRVGQPSASGEVTSRGLEELALLSREGRKVRDSDPLALMSLTRIEQRSPDPYEALTALGLIRPVPRLPRD